MRTILLLLGVLHGLAVHGAVVNVADQATAYASYFLWPPGNWDPAMLVDGDLSVSIHLDAAPAPGSEYGIDLGEDLPVHRLRIFPRQDGFDPARLSDIRVSLHADGGGVPGDEVWGTDLFVDGSNAGAGPGVVVEVEPPSPTTARWVRIQSIAELPVDYALQIAEVEIWADVPDHEVNRALHTQATASEPLYGGADPFLLIDGNRSQEIHGRGEIAPGFAYTINLGGPVEFTRIVLWARQDPCCPERLSNYRVSVHEDSDGEPGRVSWSAERFTDGGNPGSGPRSVDVLTADLDPDGEFRGQWIRIESLEDPVTPHALQLTEVQAFGARTGPASLLISRQPADQVAGVSQTATFTVVAGIPDGDSSEVAYQWQRDGEDIPGATEASYTTPLLMASDDGARFRCIVSHPGFPDRISEEAVVRVNLAYGASVTSTAPLWGGWVISQMVNGSRTDVFHGEEIIDPGFAYLIDLAADVEIEQIDLYPRQDGCCPERLANFRVGVFPDNEEGAPGEAAWSADFFTDGTNPGAGAGAVVAITADLDPDGAFAGRWIQILALDDPVPAYHLQMTELEVYGSYASPGALLEIQGQPGDFGTVPGRRARFEVSARVINGDPSLIEYQWTRNGEPIPGANESVYTTPPLAEADEGALYRVVVSYPGIDALTSDPGGVIFDGNYAKNQPARSNQRLWGALVMESLVNGVLTDFVHGDTQIAPGFAYEVDLGTEVEVSRIEIHPRQDGCCGERFTNVRISLLTDDSGEPGAENWSADLFTDGSNPGSGPGIVVTLTAEDGTGEFRGSWLRILSLDDPVGDYALQLAEVAVYGTGAIEVPAELSIQRAAGGIEITWDGGQLESATELGGEWEPVDGAVSPHVVQPLEGEARFFRVSR